MKRKKQHPHEDIWDDYFRVMLPSPGPRPPGEVLGAGVEFAERCRADGVIVVDEGRLVLFSRG